MKEEKSLRLFSDETLDSMTMALVCGGTGADNCKGGNCVAGCGCSGSNTAPDCGASANVNVSLVCSGDCGNSTKPNQY